MIAAHWVVALELIIVAAIKLIWGLNLLTTSVVTPTGARRGVRDVVRDGAFWLGQSFVLLAIFLYGALGFLLLRSPDGPVPAWFAVPMLWAAIALAAAWWVFDVKRESR